MPTPPPSTIDLTESVAGEEDPGASIGPEVLSGTPGTGENICPACGGSGKLAAGTCPDCRGTGKVAAGTRGA